MGGTKDTDYLQLSACPRPGTKLLNRDRIERMLEALTTGCPEGFGGGMGDLSS